MTLREALKHLHRTGREEAFNNDGSPRVQAVCDIIKRATTREEVDEQWFKLYGFSTCREKDGVQSCTPQTS